MTVDPVAALAAHPFLAGMGREELAALASCAEPARFPQGAVIFREGAPADAWYLLVDGDVALEISAPGRGRRVVQTLHGGDVLGWSWLFPPYRWFFDARALTDVAAIRIDAACVRALKDEDHDLGYDLVERIARVMVARLQAARLQLMDVYDAP